MFKVIDIEDILNNLDKLEYYIVTHDFNLPINTDDLDRVLSIGYPSSDEPNKVITDWIADKSVVEIKDGDIIGLGSIEIKILPKKITYYRTIYLPIKKNFVYYNSRVDFIDTSKEFFDINNVLFTNVTNQKIREIKLDKILN